MNAPLTPETLALPQAAGISLTLISTIWARQHLSPGQIAAIRKLAEHALAGEAEVNDQAERDAEKYPRVGCRRGYFVDTHSFQVARGRVALFYGATDEHGKPDRTMSAQLVCAGDSVDELRLRYPQAFEDPPVCSCENEDPDGAGFDPACVLHGSDEGDDDRPLSQSGEHEAIVRRNAQRLIAATLRTGLRTPTDTALAVAIGARVRLTQDVERFPHFIAPRGATGTIVDTGDPSVFAVRLDEPVPGAEAWDNEVHWCNGEDPTAALEVTP